MAQFFKRKKRKPSGPNKNEMKVRRGMDEANRAQRFGLVGQRFPAVQKLTIQLSFLSPQGHLIDRETRVLDASEPCDFSVSCPGRCGTGSFDLESKIETVVQTRQTSSESRGTCQQPVYGGTVEPCNTSLQCRIEVAYLPGQG